MRIAVLGLGRIGAVHASNLATFGEVEVVVFDPDPTRVEQLAEHVELARSLEAAIEGADGVVVATPTAAHAEHLLAAAAIDCPIFCEKPISIDLGTSASVLEQLGEMGVELQIGFQRRFDPGFLEMRRRIDSGELGDIYLVRAACHDHVPPPETYLPTAGSIFRDMHTHDFDAIPWLTGRRIESVFAAGSVLVDEMFARHGDVDTCAMTLTLEGGALAVLSGARANGLGYDHRTEVFGSRDSVAAGLDGRTPLQSVEPGASGPTDPYLGFADRFAAAYRAEMVAFIDLVAGRSRNRCPGSTALDALRVAVAADRSLVSGQPVRVDDVA